MSVGVMVDYKLRDLRASHTLCFLLYKYIHLARYKKNEKRKKGSTPKCHSKMLTLVRERREGREEGERECLGSVRTIVWAAYIP
jgi:hypothetical protein